MASVRDVYSSHRHTFTTGAVTTVTTGSATAGHILALRNASTVTAVRLRTLEVEFLLTTAFGSAQEVGFDAFILRGYQAAHTGATALTITGGRGLVDSSATVLTGRIADTGALTAGTHTLDTNPIAKGGVYCSAIGANLFPRLYDFTSMLDGGIVFVANEGLVVRNTIAMGATGVGKWHFTVEFDDVLVA